MWYFLPHFNGSGLKLDDKNRFHPGYTSEKCSVTREKPVSDEWTYVGKMTTSRRDFSLLEVVDGMYLLGGVTPKLPDTVTANEVCTIVDTDTVECEVVGDKSELRLIGHLGQKHFYTVAWFCVEYICMIVYDLYAEPG